LQKLGRHADAEPLYREALEINRRVFPAGHPNIAVNLNNLALVLLAQRRPADAEPLFLEALDLYRRPARPDHTQIASVLHNLSSLYLGQGKVTDAERVLHEALDIRLRALPPGHPDIARSQFALATLLSKQSRFVEAETFERQALDIRKQALHDGPTPPLGALIDLAAVYTQLAHTLLVQEQFSEAARFAREGLALTEAPLSNNWHTFSTRSVLGACLLAQQDFAAAEPLLRSGYEGLQRQEAVLPAAARPQLGETIERLVQLFEATGRPAQAAEWKQKLADSSAKGQTQKPTSVPPPE
jgi:tetratricopeptide (TPR) repeat protein